MFREIDLHGCSKIEAKSRLNTCIKQLPPGSCELTVIHGYSSTVLLNLVRKEYKNKRIKRKILTMNQGETIYIIE